MIKPPGILEIVIILVVVLIIFGPKHLPKLANSIGKSIKGLREGMGKKKETTTAEVDDAVEEVTVEKPTAGLKAAESQAQAVEVEADAVEVPEGTEAASAAPEGETE